MGYMPVIPALRRPRQAGGEIKASLGYLNTATQTNKQRKATQGHHPPQLLIYSCIVVGFELRAARLQGRPPDPLWVF
jgi:hypothetical protein